MSKIRDEEKTVFWRAAIELYADSDKSVKDFCQTEGLKAHLFYRWRKVLGLSPVDKRSKASGEESPSFVPIHLKSQIPSIEVRLPNGIEFKCCGADLSFLVRVLSESC